MSGRLTGVVSLTDVLNLFARASGLSPKDPEEERQRHGERGADVGAARRQPAEVVDARETAVVDDEVELGVERRRLVDVADVELLEGERLDGTCIAQNAAAQYPSGHQMAGSPLADYAVAGREGTTGLAGILGVLVTALAAGLLFRVLRLPEGRPGGAPGTRGKG